MKRHYLAILIFYSAIGVYPTQAQEPEEYEDPFGDYEEDWLPPMPREANYWRGEKKVEENEIVVRSLFSLAQPLEKLPLVNQSLTRLPHTKSTDTVYDVSAWFSNCDGGQWVYYNDTSDYLIANASHRLRASVSEYAQRIVERLPMKIKISATYLMMDRNVPLTLGAIKKSKHKKVMRCSGVVKSGEIMTFGKDSQQISVEGILSYSGFSSVIDINFYREGELDVKMATSLQTGMMKVLNVGIAEGDEIGVMILKVECLDMNGRVLREEAAVPKMEISNHRMIREFIDGKEYLFWRVKDLIQLLDSGSTRSEAPVKLVVNPDLDFFDEDASTYDVKELLELQGIRFGENEWVIYDSVTGLMVASGGSELLDIIEELTYGLCVSFGNNITTVTNFYEVNASSQVDGNKEWDLLNMLSRNPILLGNVGYFLSSGVKVRHSSPEGNVSLELTMDDAGRMTEQSYQMDLDFLNRKISSELKIYVPYDKPIFVELKTDPASKRTIVMMVITKKSRIYR